VRGRRGCAVMVGGRRGFRRALSKEKKGELGKKKALNGPRTPRSIKLADWTGRQRESRRPDVKTPSRPGAWGTRRSERRENLLRVRR